MTPNEFISLQQHQKPYFECMCVYFIQNASDATDICLSFAMLHTSGKESKASPTESSSQEGEEECCAQEEREEVKQALEPVSHKALVAEQRKQAATALERCHSEAVSSSEAAARNARPRVNLLNILQQGWDLRSVCILGCCSHLPPLLYFLFPIY